LIFILIEIMNHQDKSKKYIDPYLGGALLGLLLLFTFFMTGRGLGASGAVKSTVVASVHEVAPQHAETSDYYKKFIREDKSPMNNWLVFEVLGILVGAFASGALSGRLKFKVEHSPKITSKKRIIFAIIGGALFGIGSQLARGCTSGAALSGSAALATAGFLTMITIFGAAYAFAYFFRKLWI
jgi:uncharacterized membrane protein YedE/YeeE